MDKTFEGQSFSELFRLYFAIAMHWAWLLALITVLAGGSAYVFSKLTTPVYEASTLVLVNPAPATQTQDLYTLQTSAALAQTYIELIRARPILEGVINKLGLNMTPEELIKVIQAEVVGNTQLIQVKVEDTSPVRAAVIDNALIAEFSDQMIAEQALRYSTSKQNLETQLNQLDQQIQSANQAMNDLGSDPTQQAERDQLNVTLSQYRQSYTNLIQTYEQLRLAEAQSTSTIVQKEPAIPPTEPIRPQTMKNTILAAVVGLMLGGGVVVLIEAMDDSIKGPEEITKQLGLPVLGLIAAHGTKGNSLITITNPSSPVSEAFRSLRTNLQFVSVDSKLQSILVTSPSPEDGKSTIASNLGVIMAQGGHQVIVIDADLRKPMMHKIFRIPNRGGLSSLFTEAMVAVDGNLRKTDVANLRALTTGNIPPNPSELLGSEKMTRILEQISKESDFVIVDSPPVLAVTDSIVLAPKVDGVLMVVKPGTSKLQACKHAIEQLKMVNAHILGVILNDVDIKRGRYHYGYYNGYNYYYAQKGHEDEADKSPSR